MAMLTSEAILTILGHGIQWYCLSVWCMLILVISWDGQSIPGYSDRGSCVWYMHYPGMVRVSLDPRIL